MDGEGRNERLEERGENNYEGKTTVGNSVSLGCLSPYLSRNGKPTSAHLRPRKVSLHAHTSSITPLPSQTPNFSIQLCAYVLSCDTTMSNLISKRSSWTGQSLDHFQFQSFKKAFFHYKLANWSIVFFLFLLTIPSFLSLHFYEDTVDCVFQIFSLISICKDYLFHSRKSVKQICNIGLNFWFYLFRPPCCACCLKFCINPNWIPGMKSIKHIYFVYSKELLKYTQLSTVCN